jgi:voltage-gated potassium channel
MVMLLLAIRTFSRAIRIGWQDPAFKLLVIVASVALAFGTYFFHVIEGWTILDSLYFCVITLATVGYGDFTPKTTGGKIFDMFYVFIGIGLLVTLFTRIADALMKAQKQNIEKIKKTEKLGKLEKLASLPLAKKLEKIEKINFQRKVE